MKTYDKVADYIIEEIRDRCLSAGRLKSSERSQTVELYYKDVSLLLKHIENLENELRDSGFVVGGFDDMGMVDTESALGGVNYTTEGVFNRNRIIKTRDDFEAEDWIAGLSRRYL
jgi:hypothetical protein